MNLDYKNEKVGFELKTLVGCGLEFIAQFNNDVLFHKDGLVFVYERVETNQYFYRLSYKVSKK